MTKEWRLGPQKVMTQFTRSHSTLDELRRELKEELGIIDGDFKKLLKYSYSRGNRTTGFNTIYTINNFKVTKTSRDKNEIQEIIQLPIENLFNNLIENHTVGAETLLIAKLVEEKHSNIE